MSKIPKTESYEILYKSGTTRFMQQSKRTKYGKNERRESK